MVDDLHKMVVGLWFALLLVLLILRGPGGDPPAPTSPALAQGAAVRGAPADLVQVIADYAPPSPMFSPVPLTYEERFSPEAIGPDWAWAEAACNGCPIATGAVREQGVGE